jgi:hypothetical protein
MATSSSLTVISTPDTVRTEDKEQSMNTSDDRESDAPAFAATTLLLRLDASSSMRDMRHQLVAAANNFCDTHRKHGCGTDDLCEIANFSGADPCGDPESRTMMTTGYAHLFADSKAVPYPLAPLSMAYLRGADYKLGYGTPLYSTLIHTIRVEHAHRTNVVFVLFTDGHPPSAGKCGHCEAGVHTAEAAKAAVQSAENERAWKFIVVAPNRKFADAVGIREVFTFEQQNATSMSSAMESASSSSSEARREMSSRPVSSPASIFLTSPPRTLLPAKHVSSNNEVQSSTTSSSESLASASTVSHSRPYAPGGM